MKSHYPTHKQYWDALARICGCVACRLDGTFTDYVSIHHIDGRTKKGAQWRVIPLCAGHHQDGAGENKQLIAVHPYKRQFEAAYGPQDVLQEHANNVLLERMRAQ